MGLPSSRPFDERAIWLVVDFSGQRRNTLCALCSRAFHSFSVPKWGGWHFPHSHGLVRAHKTQCCLSSRCCLGTHGTWPRLTGAFPASSLYTVVLVLIPYPLLRSRLPYFKGFSHRISLQVTSQRLLGRYLSVSLSSTDYLKMTQI